MKTIKVCIYISVTVMLAGACKNNNNPDDTELKKIIKQRDSLIELSANKDSSINTFISSFAEIENNLVSIKRKEEVLIYHTKKNTELKGSTKDKIDENIKIINDLTDNNRQKIVSLNAKLRSANYTIGELDGLIDILVTNINYKNQDLLLLGKVLRADGKMLTKLNTEMIDLSGQIGLEMDTIKNEKSQLNTAYYIIDDVEGLKEKKIVNEEGGFFSPRQEERINPDFIKDYFKKIDIKKTTSIRVVAKKPKLLSTHPSDSYKIEHRFNNTQTNIIITDPDKFWSESKYLVVAID